MRAIALLVGKHDVDRRCPGCLVFVGQHLADVVEINHGDVTHTFHDRFHLGAVIALGLAGQVGLHAAQPFLRLCFTAMGDHRGGQRHHVGVLGAACADPTLPLRIREVFVGGNLTRLDAILRSDDDARPRRETEPLVVGVPILRRDVRLQRRTLGGLRDAGVHCVGQASDVRGQDQIGRAVGCLPPQPLNQSILGIDHVDRDPGLSREGVEHGFYQEWLPVGVDVDHFRGMGREAEECDDQGADRHQRSPRDGHFVPQIGFH